MWYTGTDLEPITLKWFLESGYIVIDGSGIASTRDFELFKNKKYRLLVFLKNPKKVEPFEIDKTGFGAMAAWHRSTFSH